MSCWALIPLKAPSQGKTRLSQTLDSRSRTQLIENMLMRVLAALAGSYLVDRIAIVGMLPDRCRADIRHLPDPGTGLNGALSAASQQLQATGAQELLVLHADLPLLLSEEVDQFILAGRRQGMALASDHHALGTNAIFLSQPDDFAFSFGPHSLTRHLTLAAARNLQPAMNQAPGLMFDVDTAQDLQTLIEAAPPFYIPESISHWSPAHA
ncbi:2-phospho-L-lactate guanylyltransferase [Pseudomonas saliphila]|uniref:2-phospho-L-lactate guanylyltransferase n=1 Tax=Pseudomonas saliphila TaxID=2586906 RepID=UPI0015B41A97|nr:2-phospho-L-lactate guanylyltransferase [Pseudomonas saliphila]